MKPTHMTVFTLKPHLDRKRLEAGAIKEIEDFLASPELDQVLDIQTASYSADKIAITIFFTKKSQEEKKTTKK